MLRYRIMCYDLCCLKTAEEGFWPVREVLTDWLFLPPPCSFLQMLMFEFPVWRY